MKKPLALLGVCIACGGRPAEVALPAWDADVNTALIVLGGEQFALSLAPDSLRTEPPELDASEAQNLRLYYFKETLQALSLVEGRWSQISTVGARLPTPARAFERPATVDGAWDSAPAWSGPIVSLRAPYERRCGTSTARLMMGPSGRPLWVTAIGRAGEWEERAVVIGLDDGSLLLATEEKMAPMEIPTPQVMGACFPPCVISAAFRGLGNELILGYQSADSSAEGVLWRTQLELSEEVFSRPMEADRVTDDFPILRIDGPLRASIGRLEVLAAEANNDQNNQFGGFLERVVMGETEPGFQPFFFHASQSSRTPFNRGQALYLSDEHTAALWPYQNESQLAHTGFGLTERLSVPGAAAIAALPSGGMLIADDQGRFFRYELGARILTPLQYRAPSAVTSLTWAADGLFATASSGADGAQLIQFLDADELRACAPRDLSANEALHVVEVHRDIVVVGQRDGSVVVEWFSEQAGD